MSLIQLWRSSPDTIKSYAIRQIVAVSGDGRLRDASACSTDLRAYLRETTSERLAAYAVECLKEGFEDSGLVLQDVINEVGRRLDFSVEDGRYKGRQGLVGFDGIWRADPDVSIIVEVKTTDTYNVRLDDVANYRMSLIESSRVSKSASTLFVVGRKDTGALEAQIRGSRYAWDMRVVGIDSLLQLMNIKEKSSEDKTIKQIRELLRPFEYTRVDRIIEVVFDTAADVALSSDDGEKPSDNPKDDQTTDKPTRTSPELLDEMRSRIATSLQKKLGRPLVRSRRVLYESTDKKTRAYVAVSKKYEREYQPYWYAYHSNGRKFLQDADQAFIVLGCMDRDVAYAIPFPTVESILPSLNKTAPDGRQPYWHLVLVPDDDRHLSLYSSRTGERIPLQQYELQLA